MVGAQPLGRPPADSKPRSWPLASASSCEVSTVQLSASTQNRSGHHFTGTDLCRFRCYRTEPNDVLSDSEVFPGSQHV